QAGTQLAVSLRERGYSGPVTLVGQESADPYQRPPLSKSYLLGKVDATNLTLRSANYLREHDIDYRAGVVVEHIDGAKRVVQFNSGDSLPYEHLVLATGARNRRLPIPGFNAENVHSLRDLDDARRLRDVLGQHRKVAVIGAGFIGMEFAAVARQSGLDVTVIEFAGRPFARALTDVMARRLRELHEAEGVHFKCRTEVTGVHVHASGMVSAISVAGGAPITADLVLVGVGVEPNTELAQTAGVAVDNGILVDAHLATNQPGIYAIGDCARFPSVHADGRSVRLESVQNAVDQAKCLARTLTGESTEYCSIPWFWSDQYGSKLQIAGLSDGHDRTVIRQLPDKSGFSVYCMKGSTLLAVESIDRPADHLVARKLIDQRVVLKDEEIKDPSVDLKAFLTG
ncbi:MAG: FAD-dependent oxidoreductase, partial [Pseudohongiella sp.]